MLATHCSRLLSFQVTTWSLGQSRYIFHLVYELGLFCIWGDGWWWAVRLKQAAF